MTDLKNKYATNQGVQTRAIKAMVDKLTSPLQSDIEVQNYFDGYSDLGDFWESFARQHLRYKGISYTECAFVILTQIPWMIFQYFWEIKKNDEIYG